jgi:hypothetical protein
MQCASAGPVCVGHCGLVYGSKAAICAATQVKSSPVKASQVQSSRVESSRVKFSRVESSPVQSGRVRVESGRLRGHVFEARLDESALPCTCGLGRALQVGDEGAGVPVTCTGTGTTPPQWRTEECCTDSVESDRHGVSRGCIRGRVPLCHCVCDAGTHAVESVCHTVCGLCVLCVSPVCATVCAPCETSVAKRRPDACPDAVENARHCV